MEQKIEQTTRVQIHVTQDGTVELTLPKNSKIFTFDEHNVITSNMCEITKVAVTPPEEAVPLQRRKYNKSLPDNIPVATLFARAIAIEKSFPDDMTVGARTKAMLAKLNDEMKFELTENNYYKLVRIDFASEHLLPRIDRKELTFHQAYKEANIILGPSYKGVPIHTSRNS